MRLVWDRPTAPAEPDDALQAPNPPPQSKTRGVTFHLVAAWRAKNEPMPPRRSPQPPTIESRSRQAGEGTAGSAVLLTCPIRGALTVAALAKDGLTPTEEARRIDFLHYLLHRGYPAANIAVETVVLSGLGESGRNTLRADAIVYDIAASAAGKLTGDERLAHALVVAEIKRDSKSKTSGITFQLEPAMRQLPGLHVLGVYWDDVNRILLHKVLTKTNGTQAVEVRQDSLANLPAFGQPYKSKPISLSTLVPAENLVATLLGLANVMRSHGVNDEQLRYKETVKLLLARYVDERQAKAKKGQALDLQVYEGGDPAFASRVGEVYKVAANRYSRATTLFSPHSASELPEAALRDCVRAIQGVNLSSAPSDVMQQVFMSFVPAVFKKSLDQYFTPVTLIDSMVDMTMIGPTDKIADPAMGTADFLTSAMASRTAAGDDDAAQRVFGVDKDERAYDLAVINMILNRDGQANLVNDDSLEKVSLWAEEMNVVLCNPPFGARTVERRPKVLKHYDLGHMWRFDESQGKWLQTTEVAASQQLGLLFLERCYKLLAPGGRLAIIVPEGYLCTASYGYVRQWLVEHFQILSLVELPRRIFLKSEADLRSNVLVARKLTRPGIPKSPYPIHTDLVRKVGYKLGRGYSEIAKRDPLTGLEIRNAENELILDTDFDRVRAGFHAFSQATNGGRVVPSDWSGATLSDITSTNSLDMKPRRLSTKALENLRTIRGGSHVRLGDIAEVMDQTVDLLSNKGASVLLRPVEGSDIRAIEGTVVPQEPQRAWSVAARKSAAMFRMAKWDIVIGLVRPERRNVGLLLDDGTDIVGAPDGIAIVRVKDAVKDKYPTEWLFATLRSEACRLQFWTESGGTSYGKLTRQQIRNVLIPLPSSKEIETTRDAVGEWAKGIMQASARWSTVGTSADRKPILNSPLFGLENDDELSSESEDEGD